jgi:hypothetical protein
MDIEWPPFPARSALDRPATEADIAAGRAAFVMRDASGKLIGSRVELGLPRLGFSADNQGRRIGVVIQTEANAGQCIVGIQHADGSYSVCSPEEFEAAPRCLILFHKVGFGINQALEALAGKGVLSVARMAEILAVRWGQGPVLFVRHAAGKLVAEELALIGKDSPHAAALSRCNALFEVSFLDLEEVLDEINTLIEVQCTLQEATQGLLYTGWNGQLSIPEGR